MPTGKVRRMMNRLNWLAKPVQVDWMVARSGKLAGKAFASEGSWADDRLEELL